MFMLECLCLSVYVCVFYVCVVFRESGVELGVESLELRSICACVCVCVFLLEKERCGCVSERLTFSWSCAV